MNEGLQEYGAASGRGTIADLSRERERLRLSGEDRVSFLQGQCTNDVARLEVGENCYAAFLNAKGKMRGEGHIVCLPDAFLLEANPGLAPSLEKFIITEDVTIEDVSASMGEWLVMGDAGTNVAAKAVRFNHPLGLGVIDEVGSMTATTSAETLEVLRIQAAMPKWGVDIDENTIPNEAGLEARAISYDKGCYIGQETIARIKTYGHVNRRLVQMAATGEGVPARGDKLLAEGREVGHVTSVARSSRLGKPLALGYVRREFATAGVKLKCNNETVEVLRVCGE
jgi:folate-binding protein YgfZ